MEQSNILLTAHSGADHTPENSMEFVQYALNLCPDALEVDVRNGENGELIISHDQTEKEAVTLKEVFNAVKKVPCIRINCDLKEGGLEQKVLQLTEECELPAERILFSGSVTKEDLELAGDWKCIEVYWNVEECIPDIYDNEQNVSKETADILIRECRKYGISVINMNEKFMSTSFIKQIVKNDLKISAWTVNDLERMKELLDLGVYNITTRNIKMAQQFFGKKVQE